MRTLTCGICGFLVLQRKSAILCSFLAGMLVLLCVGGTGINSLFRFNEWKANASSGLIWTCTNATTGEGHWNELRTVRLGSTATNASLGGTLDVNLNRVVQAGTSATNIYTYTVPAHTLTNAKDRLVIRASGGIAGINNPMTLAVVFGSQTVYTGTLTPESATDWNMWAEIILQTNTTPNLAQICRGGLVVIGASVTTLTQGGLTINQTNGIDTVIAVQATAGTTSVITNVATVLEWHRGP